MIIGITILLMCAVVVYILLRERKQHICPKCKNVSGIAKQLFTRSGIYVECCKHHCPTGSIIIYCDEFCPQENFEKKDIN